MKTYTGRILVTFEAEDEDDAMDILEQLAADIERDRDCDCDCDDEVWSEDEDDPRVGKLDDEVR